MTDFFGMIRDGVIEVRKFIDANRAAFTTVFRVADALVTAGGVLGGLGLAIVAAGHALGYILVPFKLATVAVAILGATSGITMAMLTGTILPVIAIAALLGTGIYLVIRNFEFLGQVVSNQVQVTQTWWGVLRGGFSAFQGWFSPITQSFIQIGETAATTFAGISDALASGNFALAAQIGLLGVQIAWRDLMASITSVWTTTLNFNSTWLSRIVFGWSAIFATFSAGVQTTWSYVVQAFRVGWNVFATSGAAAIAYTNALLNMEGIDAARAARNNEIEEGELRHNRIVGEAEADRTGINWRRNREIERLNADLTQQERVINEAPERNLALEQQRNQLQAQLADLVQEAQIAAMDTSRWVIPNRGGIGDGVMARSMPSVTGTVFADAMRGWLGSSGTPAERAVRVAEQQRRLAEQLNRLVEQNTRLLEQIARRRGAVFT